jgi:prepilin signal peptidase PulO-like enzyme (type II secretory pathway)
MGLAQFILGTIMGIAVGIYFGMRLRRQPIAAPFIECPHCSEPIKPTANVCHHCHMKVDAA